MTVPATNVGLSSIQTEFGGTNPISLSEYYLGGPAGVNPATPAPNGPIPSSGQISIGQFRGAAKIEFTVATGGTVTTDGDYKIHTFNSGGTFSVSTVGTDAQATYLLIAGGGGGGDRNGHGGGGGAGGYVEGTIPALTVTSYPITIGSGGLGKGQPPDGQYGANGGTSNTPFATANGGGGGAGTSNGNPGGSGGGAAGPAPGVASGGSATQGNPPTGIGYGNAGGNTLSGANEKSGGGGGANQAGTPVGPGNAGRGGPGGNGRQSSITGTAIYRGGGGGAGTYVGRGAGGDGGLGGGGNGAQWPGSGQAGTANTGGGGGGQSDGSPNPGGGSGVCIIRYKFQ